MRIPGRKTAALAARWLRSRLVPHGLILGYHRVAEGSWDPYSLSITPRNFAEQLAILSEFARPVSLEQLAHNRSEGRFPPGAVAVTFDDGYADNLTAATPLLEREGIPATLFVATDFLGGGFWWDELAQMMAPPMPLPERLTAKVAGRVREWSVDSDGEDGRARLLMTVHEALRPLPPADRERTIGELRGSVGQVAERPAHRALEPEELIRLSGNRLIEIGAHSRSHPCLDELSDAEQRGEIEESKRRLEELTGTPVASFSYPNGCNSEKSRYILRHCGFDRACASHPDVVRRGSDRYRLPRFWVPDWPGERFGRWLKRWLRRTPSSS